MGQIQPEYSPQEVNNLLVDIWGIGLFRFAQVFAVSPFEYFLQRTYDPFTLQDIADIKHNLQRIRSGVLKGARRIRKITDKVRDSPNADISDDELIKETGLGSFFDGYFHNHELLVRYVERVSLLGKRGIGIQKKSIIAVGWGNLVSSKSRRIYWKTLGDLYYWFWERVAPHNFYYKLKPVAGMEEYLRHQYNSHRWPGGAENYLISKLNSEGEILDFLENIYLHRWVGGKQDYLRDKLAISDDNFPRFFMNIIIDINLTSMEGLTLLAEDQSFADLGFGYLFAWLNKNVVKIPTSNSAEESLPNRGLFANADLLYKGSKIDEYFVYAMKIYRDHKQEYGNLSPLVIFPDKSYFSTGF